MPVISSLAHMRLNVSSLHTHPHSPTHHPRTTSSAPDIICTYHAHVVSWRKNTSLSRMCVCVCVSKRISTRTSDKAQPSSVPGVGSRKGAAEGGRGVSAVCCRCDVCVFAHWRRKGGGGCVGVLRVRLTRVKCILFVHGARATVCSSSHT